MLVPYNDADAIERALQAAAGQVAAVILEPVAGNMGCVPPADGYLQSVRRLTTAHGALLLFDEVITGFRVARGGAQALYGVTPDLTCLGKIIGGGMPLAAYGGRADVMARVAPEGPVYQAGTLSGNPIAVRTGLAALELAREEGLYDKLERLGARMAQPLVDAAREAGVALTVNRVGSMLTGFFCDGPVTDYASAKRADTRRYARWFAGMLDRGVYLAPSQFECAFVCTAHSDSDLDRTAEATRAVMRTL
jgi:glutamate-1-semialdehyde 2,1-aminomutase